MNLLATLLGGSLAEAFADAGAIGAGGAILLSTPFLLLGLFKDWPSEKILAKAGLAALAGAPMAVLGVTYANLVLERLG